MTALLEFKQKLKGLYAQYEIYLLPLLKFSLAAVYFTWINTNMGYMKALDSMFVVLILALICCILPSGMMIFTGFALMVGHSYALGIEVAGFMLVLILFMLILFLRFSSGRNLVLIFAPLAFGFDLPALLPVGCGLLSSAVSALPAAGGVIIYYFVRFIRVQSQVLTQWYTPSTGRPSSDMTPSQSRHRYGYLRYPICIRRIWRRSDILSKRYGTEGGMASWSSGCLIPRAAISGAS